MLCLGVSRLLPQGESLIQPDRIPKMRVLEGLSPTRKLPVDKHQGACVRRILLQLNSAYPWKDLFAQALHALRC
jgi:hypothetical protein